MISIRSGGRGARGAQLTTSRAHLHRETHLYDTPASRMDFTTDSRYLTPKREKTEVVGTDKSSNLTNSIKTNIPPVFFGGSAKRLLVRHSASPATPSAGNPPANDGIHGGEPPASLSGKQRDDPPKHPQTKGVAERNRAITTRRPMGDQRTTPRADGGVDVSLGRPLRKPPAPTAHGQRTHNKRRGKHSAAAAASHQTRTDARAPSRKARGCPVTHVVSTVCITVVLLMQRPGGMHRTV